MKRAIVIDYQLFAKDVAYELQLFGYDIQYITHKDIADSGLFNIIDRIKPTFVFSINYSPEVALICSKLHMVYISWTVDPLPPNRFKVLDGTNTATTFLFAHRVEDVEKFIAIGLENSSHLLLAASRSRMKNKSIRGYSHDISFVGVTLQKEYNTFIEYLKKLTPHLDCENIEFVLKKKYENIIETKKIFNEVMGEVPIYIKRAIEEAECENIDYSYISSGINGFYSYLHRTKIVSEIEGINIYGDEHWSKFSSHYKGIADHGVQLNQIYETSKLNFDISRFYQQSSINMRVFDSMACGGVVLTNSCDSLNKVFQEDVHYVNFDNPNWRDILNDTKKLNGISFKALKEIENLHRVSNRIKEILVTVFPVK